MATENDSPPGTPPGQRRRRPPPTIDLKAKEIPSEPLPESPPQSDRATPVETELEPPASAEATPAASEEPGSAGHEGVVEAQARAQEAPSSEAGSRHGAGGGPPEPPPWPENRPPLPWPVVGAAFGSVAAVLALFVALWWLGAFSPPDTAELERKIAALEAQLRAVAARPAPASDARALDELAARINAAEQATRRLAEIEARVGRAETAAAAPRAPAADPTLARRLGELEATVKSLNEGLLDLRKRAEENAAAVRDTASRAAAAADSAARAPDQVARGEIDTLTSRIAGIETTLRSLEQRRAAEAGRDRAARFAVAAALLRVAVERGEPYAAELAAVKALGAEARVQPLEAFAEKGLPSAETLARALGGIASAMQAVASAPPREAGLIDRLQANAERLVRIRPVTETAGDDSAAVIARAEAKAKRDDLAGARAELTRLPERTRAPAQDWIRQSEMRAAALAAARRLSADALAALGDTAPAGKDQK